MSTDTLFVLFAIVAGIVVLGLLIAGAVLVVRDTVRGRGRWGISLTPPACKECGEPPPVVRVPANARQAMWGGWTCPRCGLEVDKWGDPVPGQAPAKWSANLDDPRGRAPDRRNDERYKNRDEGTRRGGDIRD